MQAHARVCEEDKLEELEEKSVYWKHFCGYRCTLEGSYKPCQL